MELLELHELISHAGDLSSRLSGETQGDVPSGDFSSWRDAGRTPILCLGSLFVCFIIIIKKTKYENKVVY